MILTINAGSTSLKYALFDKSLKEIARGEFSGEQLDIVLFDKMVQELKGTEPFKKGSVPFRLSVVHRIVHGGPKYRDPIKITSNVIKILNQFNSLAPLHNPYNIKGIELAQHFFPRATHYAVFDTGFYKDLPLKTKLYPLPEEFYKNYGIQRYGFHGISHQYAALKAGEKSNLITLHLGGGCSITAIKNGKPIDTSMGFTPMEGLMMWSRAGDVDAGIILNPTVKINNWYDILNHHSGLKGVSECKDYLDLLKKYKQGNKKARLAMDMFVYRIQKYIGAYYAVLQGKVDAIVFTGKIGAGEPITRQLILKGLPFLRNVKKIIVPPNEELMMARIINQS